MVSLIIGRRGTGKTKRLIDLVNASLETSNGNVICVEKEKNLTYDINYRARLIAADSFEISGYEALFGFISGICAGDHDITDLFIDATLRIGGRDFDALNAFLKKIKKLSDMTDTKIIITLSADLEELPAEIFDYCEKI